MISTKKKSVKKIPIKKKVTKKKSPSKGYEKAKSGLKKLRAYRP